MLTPDEVGLFRSSAEEYEAGGQRMWKLARKPSGTCVFLCDEMMHCLAYERRPLECRLYPFLLDFSNGEHGIRLDTRHCPRLGTLEANEKDLLALVSSYKLTPQWIAGYLASTDCNG